jgi:ribosomal protein S18 acetylase RimI-like enzyme
MSSRFSYAWRGELTDAEMCELVSGHGGRPTPDWWDGIRPHSLGWVAARASGERLVGFVNVAWDGGDHAFLLDTKTHRNYQRQGIGRQLVGLAAVHAKAAWYEWLHVDFDDADRLEPYYFETCGFRSTTPGLIHLPSISDS